MWRLCLGEGKVFCDFDVRLVGFFVFCVIYFFSHICFFRSTEHDYVKDNLPAKLFRIRMFGKMKLEDFKEMSIRRS